MEIKFTVNVDLGGNLPPHMLEEVKKKLEIWTEIEMAYKASQLFSSVVEKVEKVESTSVVEEDLVEESDRDENNLNDIWEAIPDIYEIKKLNKSHLKTKSGARLLNVTIEEEEQGHYRIYNLTFSQYTSRESLLAFLEWSGALGIPVPYENTYKAIIKGQGIIPCYDNGLKWTLKVPLYHWEEFPNHYTQQVVS